MTAKSSPIPHTEMANAIRALSMDAIHQVQTGHIGLPLGAADVATVLFTRFLKYDPAHPDWPDRDRFVLSAGHGSMLLYSLAYLTGYEAMSLEQIKKFRRLGSLTPGHPEFDIPIGVESTTGPLGQGIGNAVGMALAERMLNEQFGDDLVDHYTYVLAGDGCLMEGISYEAMSLAGHLKLNKLIVLFDDNRISIDGPVNLATSEDQQARFQACGWHWEACDGHDPEAIEAAINSAKAAGKPAIVACRTTIGFSLPGKANTAAAHGTPPNDEEVAGARKALGWKHAPFEVPRNVLSAWREAGRQGTEDYEAWCKRLAAASSQQRDQFLAWQEGEIGTEWRSALADIKTRFAETLSDQPTRAASKSVMEALTPLIPNLIGGSADLTPSNLSRPDGIRDISPDDYSGRYIHYGIREHAMAAISNGLALHKGLLPYCATFLCFSDYCRPSIRLTALMAQKVIYILTHDSITQGPDGPTHQPVEHFVSLRAMPNLLFLRPADSVEVAECWELALEAKNKPVAMILTREAVPQIRSIAGEENQCRRGAYVIAEAEGPAKVTLLATGSEVAVALEARTQLAERGIPARVVSMPCLELFDNQTDQFKREILRPDTLRVSVEAASCVGWDKYVGPDGLILGMSSFGASGLPEELMQHFGFTGETVAAAIDQHINQGDLLDA